MPNIIWIHQLFHELLFGQEKNNRQTDGWTYPYVLWLYIIYITNVHILVSDLARYLRINNHSVSVHGYYNIDGTIKTTW